MANENVSSWRHTGLEKPTDTLPERSGSEVVGGIDSGVAQHDSLMRMLAGLWQQQRTIVVLRY